MILITTTPHRTLAAIRQAAGTLAWSREQIDQLLDLARRGYGHKRIARLLDRSQTSVHSKLQSLKRKGAL